jgi:hypothetical protein
VCSNADGDYCGGASPYTIAFLFAVVMKSLCMLQVWIRGASRNQYRLASPTELWGIGSCRCNQIKEKQFVEVITILFEFGSRGGCGDNTRIQNITLTRKKEY